MIFNATTDSDYIHVAPGFKTVSKSGHLWTKK